jgi:hypothetical protein
VTDEMLNHLGDRFVRARLADYGLTFEEYLDAPHIYDTLTALPRPLLPAQRVVALRLASAPAECAA